MSSACETAAEEEDERAGVPSDPAYEQTMTMRISICRVQVADLGLQPLPADGARPKCQACRLHRPGRRLDCQSCGRKVGPCCILDDGCRGCRVEPEPEPQRGFSPDRVDGNGDGDGPRAIAI